MIVFKACIKIMLKNKIMLTVYFLVFTLMSVSMASSSSEKNNDMFDTKNVKVSIINNDNSQYADSLIKYIEENAKIVEIINTEEGIAEALFYRITEYVVDIPEGFGRAVEEGNDISIDKYQVAGTYSAVFMDDMINGFINRMKMAGADVSIDSGTKVIVEEATESNMKLALFNFAAYAIMANILTGVGALLSSFGKTDVRRRNIISPVSCVKIQIGQICGSVVFTDVIWLLMCIISVGLLGIVEIGIAEILMMINMLIFSLVMLSMGFFIGTLVQSENGRMICANVISLGFAFIGGVFVPTNMMGETVKIVGSFTPSYWYTKINDAILSVQEFTLSGMGDIWKYVGILILFAVAFIGMGMAATRRKQ